MLRLYFKNIKAISTNKKFRLCKNKMYVSDEFKVYQQVVNLRLRLKQKEIKSFLEDFDLKKHFELKIYFSIPFNKLVSKKNSINKRSTDIDNICKPIIDLIFSNFKKINPEIDDSQILILFAEKKISENLKYHLDIYIDMRNNGFGQNSKSRDSSALASERDKTITDRIKNSYQGGKVANMNQIFEG